MNSEEIVTKRSSKSRSSGSRSSTRKSHRSSNNKNKTGHNSHSPKRNEPRQSKKSKEEHEAKDKAREERNSASATDHTGAVEPIEGRNKHWARKRRSQQNRVAKKDAVAKANNLLDRMNEPNMGPTPGAHADSRGTQVSAKEKTAAGKEGYCNRPLVGTQAVFTKEEREWLEAEKGDQEDHVNTNGFVAVNAVESHDVDLALALLNALLDEKQQDASDGDNHNKQLDESLDGGSSVETSQNKNHEHNDESNETDWERLKQKKSVRICQCLFCIVVIVGAAVGTWLGMGGNNFSVPKEPSQGDEVPNTEMNITNVPMNSSTLAPNSNADVGFDPPSTEDCAAITNGEAIQGQEAMPVQSHQLELDAITFLPTDLGLSAIIIEDKLRDLLALTLTGCNRRDLDGSFSYAIGNVAVDASGVEGVQCLDESNPRCHRVSVALDIVVKDATVMVIDVIGELSAFFGGEVLAVDLELDGLYESIAVVNVTA